MKTTIIMSIVTCVITMIREANKGEETHQNPYCQWKKSCINFETWLGGPLAPGFNIGRAPWSGALRCEWKESCTTRRDLNIDVGGPGGLHKQAAQPAHLGRWCRIVSIDRLEFCVFPTILVPHIECLTRPGGYVSQVGALRFFFLPDAVPALWR